MTENEQAKRSLNPPALSISAPPPPGQRAMSYVLTIILLAALALALGGVLAYWLRA